MDCKAFQALVSRHGGRVPPAPDTDAFHHHADGCRPCRDLWLNAVPGHSAGDPSSSIATSSAQAVTGAPFVPGAAWTPPPRFDQFELKRRLGSGAMGIVYQCWDVQLNRDVAVKFLAGALPQASDRARVMREAQAMAKIAHPNVVAVHDIGSADGHSYLVSELVRGRSLADLRTPPPWPRLLRLARDLASGLAAAHQQGVTHRDIKPGNIMLTDDDHAKLIDFGLAIHSDEAAGPAGTPRYMAPEVRSGAAATFRSDVYSLGLVLRTLSHEERRPASSAAPGSGGEAADRTAGGEPARSSPPWSHRRFAAVIDCCCEADPVHRPASAIELVALLERAAETALRWQALRRWSRRLLPPATALLVAILSLSVVVARRTTRRAEADRAIALAEQEATGRDPGRALPWLLKAAEYHGGLTGEGEEQYGRHYLLAREVCERGLSWEVARHDGEPVTLVFSPAARNGESCATCWPQEQLLVSASRDGGLRLSDLKRGGAARALVPPHDGFVFGLAVSPDGRWLASGSSDGRLRIWELPQGELRHSFTAPKASKVWRVAFSPDGRYLAAGGADYLETWDARTWRSLFRTAFDVYVGRIWAI